MEKKGREKSEEELGKIRIRTRMPFIGFAGEDEEAKGQTDGGGGRAEAEEEEEED